MPTIPLPQWINEHDLVSSFEHIKVNRKGFPDHCDIWHIRFHWDAIKPQLLTELNQGRYRLSAMQLIEKKNGERLALWSAQDAIVLHALCQYLSPIVPLHTRCEHIQGHGGGKRSIVKLHQHIQTRRTSFVLRTDIRGYYANIDKATLLHQLKRVVDHPIVLDLLTQFIHYSVERGGLFHTPKKGIARSASLSPLLAAFHLHEIDAHFSQQPHCYYARYMDDFIILVSRRWHLRHAIKSLNRFFAQFGFKQHPDKTFIGRCQKGFDWMGF